MDENVDPMNDNLFKMPTQVDLMSYFSGSHQIKHILFAKYIPKSSKKNKFAHIETLRSKTRQVQ